MSPSRSRRARRARPRLLALEHRLAPAAATLVSGVLMVNYTATGGSSESVTVTNDGTIISLSGNIFGTEFPTADVKKLVVQDSGGSSAQKVTIDGTADYTLSGGLSFSGVEEVIFNRAVAVTGAGAVDVSTPKNVVVSAPLSTVDGDLSLVANQQTTPSAGQFSGIYVGANLTVSGTGGLNLVGRGGTTWGIGVYVAAGMIVSGGTTNAVNITGSDSSNSGSSLSGGVQIGGVVQSAGASVNVSGQGGNGDGVLVYRGTISASGMGAVNVNGQAGNGKSNSGVRFHGGAISASGMGAVTVTGIGGSGTWSTGVEKNAGTIESAGGDVTIIGAAKNDSLADVFLSGLVATGGMGRLTIITNTLSIHPSDSAATLRAGAAGNSTVTFRTLSADRKISIGDIGSDSSTTLGLWDSELDQVFASLILIGADGSAAYPGPATGSVSLGPFSHANDANFVVVTARDINAHADWKSSAGNLSLIANQQTPTSVGDFVGIKVDGSIQTTSGAVTLRGRGGNSASQFQADGVYIASSVTTTGGSISINGTGGQNSGSAIRLVSSPFAPVVSAGGNGALQLTGDGAIQLVGTVKSGGTMTLSANQTISNTASLTCGDTLLFDAPGQTVWLGGKISAASAVIPAAVNLMLGNCTITTGTAQVSGTLAGNGSLLGAVNVMNGGRLSPFGSGGAATITTGNAVFNAGAALDLDLSSTVYERLRIQGTVDLGGATLNTKFTNSPTNHMMRIVDNDGVDAITGTFAGLPEGSTFTFNGREYKLSYQGGDGNDATLSGPPNVISVTFGDGTSQRSTVRQIVVNFSEPVSFIGPVVDAFTLTRSGSTGAVGLTASPANGPAGSVTLTFAGSLTEFDSLIDGFYNLTVHASNINGLDGNNDFTPGDNFVIVGNSTNKFFRLFGDVDGSGTVNNSDVTAFRTASGSVTGDTHFNPAFDFDADNDIDIYDLIRFRQRLGMTP